MIKFIVGLFILVIYLSFAIFICIILKHPFVIFEFIFIYFILLWRVSLFFKQGAK